MELSESKNICRIKIMKKDLELKQKIINSIMKNGNKKTAEKIIKKSLKLIQKSDKKNYINLLKHSIINSTPTFKINVQSKKRGKRKTKKEIPTFIGNNSLRIIAALNFLTENSLKNKELNGFYKKITNEIIETASPKSKSIEQKNEIQKQVLMQKRYLANFRW